MDQRGILRKPGNVRISSWKFSKYKNSLNQLFTCETFKGSFDPQNSLRSVERAPFTELKSKNLMQNRHVKQVVDFCSGRNQPLGPFGILDAILVPMLHLFKCRHVGQHVTAADATIIVDFN